MPIPIAVCIEDFSTDLEKPGFVSCVAVSGREPGLRLDSGGTVLWKSDEGVACELWVSADERLILFRPEGAPPVTVRRAGRSLDVPFGKPVVVIDQDEVDVGGRNLRLHVHGQTGSIHEPEEIVPRKSRLGGIGRVAAAVALGTALTTGALIEVRCSPPEIEEPEEEGKGGGSTQDEEAKPPIDVRDQPPLVAPDQVPKPPPKPPIDVREKSPQLPEEPPDKGENEDKTGQTQQTNPPPIDVRDTPPKPAPREPKTPPGKGENEDKTGQTTVPNPPEIEVIDRPPRKK
jgi:hypothetical protein